MIQDSIKKITSRFSSTTKSGIINMCLKPISMILSLVYTPLLVAYLGDEKYGLWATLLSIINWVNYFDVGIGNGLRNLLSEELSENQIDKAKKTVSTAYVVLTMIACCVYVVLLVLIYTIDWNNVFASSVDMRLPLLISFSFICINFVLALSNSILYALQKSERVAMRGCIVQAINLLGLLILKQFTNESIIAVSVLFGISTLTVYVINTIEIFKARSYLKPKAHLYDRQKIKNICHVGIKFFVIQIMCLMLFTVDNLLITHYFGAEAVTPFAIANKVFQTAYMLLAAFLVPYWSRTTVAYSKRDCVWIKKSVLQTLKICGLFIFGYITLCLIFKPVVTLWMGRMLPFPKYLIVTMCAFYTVYSILGVECQFINGSGKITVQFFTSCFAGCANIPFSIFLGVHCGLGVVGIRLATTILVFIEIIVLGINLNWIIKELEKKEV